MSSDVYLTLCARSHWRPTRIYAHDPFTFISRQRGKPEFFIDSEIPSKWFRRKHRSLGNSFLHTRAYLYQCSLLRNFRPVFQTGREDFERHPRRFLLSSENQNYRIRQVYIPKVPEGTYVEQNFLRSEVEELTLICLRSSG